MSYDYRQTGMTFYFVDPYLAKTGRVLVDAVAGPLPLARLSEAHLY